MYFHNKKDELEFENSDRQLFGSHPRENEFIEKIGELELAPAWPFVPLMNFEKEAHKMDQIYNANKVGDNPPDEVESEEKPNAAENDTLAYPSAKIIQIGANAQSPQNASYFLADHSFNSIELFWENLTIQASYKEKTRKFPLCGSVKRVKTILHAVTGIAKPGTFTAILGPSGSF